MTYIDHINHFWEKYHASESPPSADEALLYFCILDNFNRTFWESEWIEIRTKRLEQELKWDRHRIIRTRHQLAERGLIECTTYQGRKSPEYKLCVRTATQEDLCVSATTQCVYVPPHKIKVFPEPLSNIIKDVKDNMYLFAGAGAHARWRVVRPSKDEVLKHGEEIGMSPTDAESFWAHYEGSSWMMGNGLPVADWKAKMIERQITLQGERQKGPKVHEKSRRGKDNSDVETQSPDTSEILAKRTIQNMIDKAGDKELMRQYANRALEHGKTYEGARQILVMALRDGNEVARKYIGL